MFEGNSEGAKKASEETEKASQKTAAEVVKHGEQIKQSHHEVEEENSKLAESFDKVREHAHEMTERLIEHAFEIAAAFKAMFEVEKVIENFFEQAEKSDQLGETARQIGVNIEQLDAWGQAVRRVGGTAEGFEGSLKAVEFRMQRIALAAAEGKTGGDRSSRFFKALGIDPKDATDIFKLLEEIPKKIENMPKQQSNALLRGIGLDDGTIRLLQSGSKEVEELIEKQKRLGSITMEDAQTAEAFNREWMDVKELFRNITVDLDTAFLPTLQWILEGVEEFVEFLRDHKEFVEAFFLSLVVAAGAAAEAFGVLGAIIGFVFSPIVLVVAAIVGISAAIAFLYDDIVNFAEGNNSVIGELAKRWPIVGEAVRALIEVFKDINMVVNETYKLLVDSLTGAFDGVAKAAKFMAEAIAKTFDWLWEKIGWIFEKLSGAGKAISSAVSSIAGKVLPSTPTAALSGEDHATERKATTPDGAPQPELSWKERVAAAKAWAPSEAPTPWHEPGIMSSITAAQTAMAETQSPLMAQTPQSLAADNSKKTENHIDASIGSVTINVPSGDPEAIQKGLQDHLADHYKSVLTTFADGVTH